MNDSVSILVAVFLILIALRWMLGGNQPNQQQPPRRSGLRRAPHRVTPQMIDMVRAMFPDIPTAAIQADLQRTGSVETTVDNALRDGGLPIPPPISPQQSSPNSNSSTPSNSRKSPVHPNLIQRYHIDVNKSESPDFVEPPKVWESSPDKRQEMLRKRKEFMVLQARKKLLDLQKQQSASQLTMDTEGKKVADEMSVDELNALSAEERRNQMLQALEKRSTNQ
ncbi:hypothetical protein BDB01DRAFT_831524 [Pilobolus umbonatus]|nr:hypothetical protein BDB01DRAFT_831524 [Pilobolus umbonatus]